MRGGTTPIETPCAPELQLAESILYLTALLADQPRPIDRHIDYFGGTPRRGRELARAA